MKRERLPNRRNGYNQKCSISYLDAGDKGEPIRRDLKLYIRTGEYADGRLGEIFVDVDRQGTMIRSLMSCFCIVVSIALQFGCPLPVLANQFIMSKFEPGGPVKDHPRIKNCCSILDLIFRDLMIHYEKDESLAHVKGE